MLRYCLSREEISRFLEIEIAESVLYDDEVKFRDLLDMCCTWEAELICLTSLLSIALERQQRIPTDVNDILKKFYALRDIKGMNLTIEELDKTFVTYMLTFPRSNDSSLEEELLEIRQRLSDYIFIR